MKRHNYYLHTELISWTEHGERRHSELQGFRISSIVRYPPPPNLDHNICGNCVYFRPQVRRETPTSLLGPLERANLNLWTIQVSITVAT
jgi:hypothetical protein